MKKELDKASASRFREIYAHYYQQQKDNNELSGLIKEKPDSIKPLSEAPPWSHFYELPYRTFLALCILEFDLTETVHKIAQSDNKIQTFLEYMENLDDLIDTNESLSNEEKALRFSLVLAVMNQISSVSIHSQPLSTLVDKVRKGDDNALFDAVLVDRSIVSAPTIAHRIQIAHLMEDENFMELLSKAIKRSRPKRPEKELDDLRYMIEVIDEEIGLNNITRTKLHDILAKDLELYDYESLSGFKKIIQRRNKRHRT